ncbi:MAG TPA: DNA topoisomerase VI subunit B, partial [Thermofilum sp.]|nr:DNA topoisomerase VI subunit B [Thermofilum sp.]
GESLLKQGVKRILNPSYVTAVTRPPSSFGGNPFIVEVALAYGGDVPQTDAPTLYRFANRIPLLYDEGADVSRKVISNIDWSIYKVKFPAPLAIVTHICSTKIPFKGVGKEAIAEVPEVEKELEIAIREVARRLRRHLSKLEKIYEVKRRKTIIGKYIPEVSRALAYVSNLNEKVLAKKLQAMLEKDIKTRGVINVPAA